MKRGFFLLLTGLLALSLAACSGQQTVPEEHSSHDGQSQIALEESIVSQNSSTPSTSDAGETEENSSMTENVFYITIGGSCFAATFADNAGAAALKELLADGPVTIEMEDYGSFEKVGAFGQPLPTENVQTTTQAGDIVLYQGNQIVLFYGSNSWSYTRLGKVEDLTGWQEALGSGGITAVLSLDSAQ